jgi:6-phosphogluconolactonase
MATRLRNPLNVFPDRDAMSRAVARALVDAVSARTRFTIALSGGSTPQTLYRLLASDFREQIPWERIHLFWSDERYVAPDHPHSNVGMLRNELIDRVPIPEANVHAPRTDLEDAEEAARLYEDDVRRSLGPELRFDWMLLGLGEDGHVASLFSGSAAADERDRLVVAVSDSPKPPRVRLTMTPPLINLSRDIHMLVAGASKRNALERLAKGQSATWLRPPTLWVDRAASIEDGPLLYR